MLNTKLIYWQHVNPDANQTMFPSNKLINPNSCYLVEIINNASADEVTKDIFLPSNLVTGILTG